MSRVLGFGRVCAMALLWAAALSTCVEVDPVLNEACASASHRCPENLDYDECVSDTIDTLESDPSRASAILGCLGTSDCAGVEACLE